MNINLKTGFSGATLLTFVLAFAAASTAQADTWDIPGVIGVKGDRVDFAVGGALEAATVSGAGILIEATAVLTNGKSTDPVRLDEWSKGKKFWFYARAHGDLSITWTNGAFALPSYELDVVPVEYGVANGSTAQDGGITLGEHHMVQFQAAPFRVFRNTVGDQNFAVRVSAIGIELDSTVGLNLGHITSGDRITAFATLAADAVGIKMINHVASIPVFNLGVGPSGQLTFTPATGGITQDFMGTHVVGVDASAGVRWTPNDSFSVSVSLGGSADFNVGRNGSGLALQSDTKAYFAVKGDIKKTIQMFLEAARIQPLESNDLFALAQWRLLLGGSFLF